MPTQCVDSGLATAKTRRLLDDLERHRGKPGAIVRLGGRLQVISQDRRALLERQFDRLDGT